MKQIKIMRESDNTFFTFEIANPYRIGKKMVRLIKEEMRVVKFTVTFPRVSHIY